jgi:hypothetical protein
MEFRYDTYCGLYCGACAVLAANRSGSVKEAAESWDMNPEDLHCYGCKTQANAVFCTTCDIKACAENNAVDFCFQCSEYPCTRLVEFNDDENPHHSVVLKNSEEIIEKGVTEWLDEQEQRWSCPECGTAFTWYDKVCETCGNSLYDCREEEKEIKKT